MEFAKSTINTIQNLDKYKIVPILCMFASILSKY